VPGGPARGGRDRRAPQSLTPLTSHTGEKNVRHNVP
jgi:hypothetical protein